jgi:hypothetical protein
LFVMVKLFYLKASNRWSDCSFMDLLMLLTDNLSDGFGGGKNPHVQE